MKYILLYLIASANAFSLNPGYWGCQTEEWLDHMVMMSVNKDYEGLQLYKDLGRCVTLRDDLTIHVIDAGWGKMHLLINGMDVWVLREAIKR